jgi:predicted flavoprotein YhiN
VWWLEQERQRPRAQVTTILATRVPSAVADVWLDVAGIGSDVTMAHLARDDRRRLYARWSKRQ